MVKKNSKEKRALMTFVSKYYLSIINVSICVRLFCVNVFFFFLFIFYFEKKKTRVGNHSSSKSISIDCIHKNKYIPYIYSNLKWHESFMVNLEQYRVEWLDLLRFLGVLVVTIYSQESLVVNSKFIS